ncbi:succinate dehydrogenase [Xylogone sp. PMI_703]|nr:succinate dehydrogenase [Xylogone sp. PMI_703]
MYLEPDGKDQETDVIVIGTGPGGLSAVGAAVEAGAQVVAIEAHKQIGGNGLLSTGYVAFVNSAQQQAQGLRDSVKIFMEDCKKLVAESSEYYGVVWDEELTRLYAERSAEMYDILTARGVKFTRLVKRPSTCTVERMAAAEDTKMFPAAFERDFAGPNVTTYVSCAAQRLLFENEVVKGVQVQSQDGHVLFTVRARKGVILATGGYQANPALRRRYQPDNEVMEAYAGLPTCRGDGHLLGQSIGGDLINMTMIPELVVVASHVTASAIAVNANGRRFHDEAGPYTTSVAALKQQKGRKGYYIWDNKTQESEKYYINQMPCSAVSGKTLEELATKIGVPPEALKSEVGNWNAFLTSGQLKDPCTGRVHYAADRRPMEQGPFWSKPMTIGIGVSCGGFVTTTKMQVVDIFGKVIPGLFAVGDTAGGMTPISEMGGTHLGGGFVFGRVAGLAAAKGEHAEPYTRATFGQFLDKTGKTEMRTPIVNVSADQLKAKQ